MKGRASWWFPNEGSTQTHMMVGKQSLCGKFRIEKGIPDLTQDDAAPNRCPECQEVLRRCHHIERVIITPDEVARRETDAGSV